MVQCDEVSPQPGTLSTQTPTTAYAGVASWDWNWTNYGFRQTGTWFGDARSRPSASKANRPNTAQATRARTREC